MGEIKCLIEEAEEPVPELHRDEPGVVSPVKVTLTPAKENVGEDEDAEEEDEEVTLVDDGEVDAPRKPLLWEVELLLTEQKEEDDEKDPEYVPPSSGLEISLDYDEYSDGEISDDEVQSLKVDMQAQTPVPSDYIAVWVKVDSPLERINKAKEEHASDNCEKQEEILATSETSGKESGADDKVDADIASTSTLESDGARKKSLSGSSNDGKLKLVQDASGEMRRNSSCSNLSAGSNPR